MSTLIFFRAFCGKVKSNSTLKKFQRVIGKTKASTSIKNDTYFNIKQLFINLILHDLKKIFLLRLIMSFK